MKLKLSKNLGLTIFAIILLAVVSLCSGGLVIIGIQEGDYMSAVCFSALLFAVLAAAVIFARGLRRWEIVLGEKSLIYTPMFGAPKDIPYSGLQKINTGGDGYILYTLDGKRLLTLYDFRVENASQAVTFLKNKGVKSEI